MHDPREHFALANRHVVEADERIAGQRTELSDCAKPAVTRQLQRTCCAIYSIRANSWWLTKSCWNARWPNGARSTPNTSPRGLGTDCPISPYFLNNASSRGGTQLDSVGPQLQDQSRFLICRCGPLSILRIDCA